MVKIHTTGKPLNQRIISRIPGNSFYRDLADLFKPQFNLIHHKTGYLRCKDAEIIGYDNENDPEQ